VPAIETEAAAKARAERRAYLTERGYRVADVAMAEVEADVGTVLDQVAAAMPSPMASKT
jgi:tRNA/rRNA methyltransferase